MTRADRYWAAMGDPADDMPSAGEVWPPSMDDEARAMRDAQARQLAVQDDAADAASRRGHQLGAWSSQATKWHPAIAACVHCGAEAHATADPPPNGVDVGGPAVALNCDDGDRHCPRCGEADPARCDCGGDA